MQQPNIHFQRTRLAPTPSGFLHLGNILSFAVTAKLARLHGAKILLRIDDLDRTRANKKYVQDIFDTLNFLEIPWDEGPRNAEEFETEYSQIHRMHLYHAALKQLEEKGLVYACICSRQQLQNNESQKQNSCNCFDRKLTLDTPDACWRLITRVHNELAVTGYNAAVMRTQLPPDMRNFIVKKKDGFPSYQLASVVDDLYFGVDLVVRGSDLWPSTLAQHQLASELGFEKFNHITFYHHHLLTGGAGEKLSKSAGATSVCYLRENGKRPAEIYIVIARMLGSSETIVNWKELSGIMKPFISGLTR